LKTKADKTTGLAKRYLYFLSAQPMSALGQKQTWERASVMSAKVKIRIALQGLRSEDSVAEPCRKRSGVQATTLRTPPPSPGP